MNGRVLMLIVLTLFLGTMVDPSNVSAEGGSIAGRVGFTDLDGTESYGDWVRVFLTTAPVSVPSVDLGSVDHPLARRSRINTGHVDFFVSANPGSAAVSC